MSRSDPKDDATLCLVLGVLRERGEAGDEAVAQRIVDELRARGLRVVPGAAPRPQRRGTPPGEEYARVKAGIVARAKGATA